MSGIHRRSGVLTAACLGLVFGCQTFKLALFTGAKNETPAADPVPARPSKYSFRVAQFVFYSDFELDRDAGLFRELAGLREQITKELQLPVSDALVHVYLFKDKDRYNRFMKAKYPDLPERRAFFVAQPHSIGGGEDLLVYTSWGNRIRQDLRHELTHALLHSVLKDVPLWLDEGLAEYFELPPSSRGVNPAHVKNLRQPSFQPNLARLEQLSAVGQMEPARYQEAWAWVYLMLRGNRELKNVLLTYLQELRTNPNPGPLQPRLAAVEPSPEDALQKMLARLEETVATTDLQGRSDDRGGGRR